MKFFSLDSKFYRIMMPVGELMILNVCWIIASLPLVTMGAANTAMYTIMGRRLRKEGSGTIAPFFRAWLSNLKTSTLFWLAQVFVTCSLVLTFFLPLPRFFRLIAGVMLVPVTMVLSTVYPQIARFRNRPFAYLRNAIILDVLKLGRVLLNLLVCLSPVLLFLLVPYEFLQFGFIWIFFGFSFVFYLSAKVMQNILSPLEEVANHR